MFRVILYTSGISILEQNDSGAGLTQRSQSLRQGWTLPRLKLTQLAPLLSRLC